VRKRLPLSDERGATAIEFAFVAPILLAILFATIEVGVLGLMSNAFDSAVSYASRSIRTGQSDGPSSATTFEDGICARMPIPRAECRSRLNVSVRRFATFESLVNAAADVPDGSFNAGAAGDLILVKATYRWPMLVPNFSLGVTNGTGEVLMDSRSAFKNEPYGL
jgi:Flp pilus assembly protein TadG